MKDLEQPDRSTPVEEVEAPDKHETNHDLVDDEVAKYANEGRVEIDSATNSRLKKMIDKRVLVVMMVTYFTQALDKGTMSFASIMGIIQDANLTQGQYSWLTTIIYIVVLLVEYPENLIIQKVPIAKWLSFNVVMWGIVLGLHAVALNFPALIVLRGLLGAFEAACQPTFVLLSSLWYKRDEQASTITYWYMMNGFQQIFGGLIAFGFSFIPDRTNVNISSWQALFMTYGILTVIWGVFIFFWMPDSPMKAKCFSEDDKKLIIERVRENQTGLQNRTFRKNQVWDAFADPQLYAFAAIQFLTTLPSGGIGAYANILVKSFGFSTWETQLLQMVIGAIQIGVMTGSAFLDRRYKQTTLAMMGATLPTIVGAVVLISVPFTAPYSVSKRVGLLIAYYLMYTFWACSGLALSLVSRNVAGSTKKSIIIASNFFFWAAGNAVGPQCFREQDSPRYFLALSIILGCFILLEIVIFALRSYYALQNKRRDARVASGEVAADNNLTHAFEDITDRENPLFRYSY